MNDSESFDMKFARVRIQYWQSENNIKNETDLLKKARLAEGFAKLEVEARELNPQSRVNMTLLRQFLDLLGQSRSAALLIGFKAGSLRSPGQMLPLPGALQNQHHIPTIQHDIEQLAKEVSEFAHQRVETAKLHMPSEEGNGHRDQRRDRWAATRKYVELEADVHLSLTSVLRSYQGRLVKLEDRVAEWKRSVKLNDQEHSLLIAFCKNNLTWIDQELVYTHKVLKEEHGIHELGKEHETFQHTRPNRAVNWPAPSSTQHG